MLLECHQAGHQILDLQAHQVECRRTSNIHHQLHRHIHRRVQTISLEQRQVHHIRQQAHPTVQQAQFTHRRHLTTRRHRRTTTRLHQAILPTRLTLRRLRHTVLRVPSIKQQVRCTLRRIHQRVHTRRLHHRTAQHRRCIRQQVRIICRQVRTTRHVRLPSRQRLQATVLRVQNIRHRLRFIHRRVPTTQHLITRRAHRLIRLVPQSTVHQVQATHQRHHLIALLLNTRHKVHQATILQQVRVIQVHQAVLAIVQLTVQAEARNIHQQAQFTVQLHLFILKKIKKQVLLTQALPPVALKKNSNNSKTNINAGKELDVEKNQSIRIDQMQQIYFHKLITFFLAFTKIK